MNQLLTLTKVCPNYPAKTSNFKQEKNEIKKGILKLDILMYTIPVDIGWSQSQDSGP